MIAFPAVSLGFGLATLACSGCSKPAPATSPDPVAAEAPPPPPQTSPSTPPAPSGSGPTSVLASNAGGCAATGMGKNFDVGDGQKYKTLGQVPWTRLGAGDAVRVHWQPQPYREKILLSAKGSERHPVRVCGIRGPNGERPVLDGENAITEKGLDFAAPAQQRRGLLAVSILKSQRWGEKPRHIVIEGLELRNAAAPNTFTDTTGASQSYTENAACIFVERGENIVVRDNEVHGCGNGIFVASGDSEEVQSRNILVERNYVHGNGSSGAKKDQHHSIYTEAIGITFQLNRFGPLREGSLGNQIKDRSAGTVVRYNWFEGGSRALDLVEPEDSTVLARKEPSLRKTYVYGNVISLGARASSRPIHYGGDNGDVATYRKGTLYFYDNTIALTTNEREQWNVAVLTLETDDESAEVRNNIIYSAGTTHVSWLHEKGTAKLGVNWVSRGITPGKNNAPAKIEMLPGGNTILGDTPGFVDVANRNYCLASSSPARGAAKELENIPANMTPTLQYAKHQTEAPRSSLRDLGALACD